ncbi:MAG TPA: chemotaxis protein CheC [Longimicrobiales bacterium]
MLDVRELGSLQRDALREVANIGAGHAATALSQLTGRRIWVDAPQIQVVRVEDVGMLTGHSEEIVACVVMQVLGDLAGRTLQVFPERTACRLAGILLGRDDITFPDGFGEVEKSALKEAGNILGAAYLNALSDFLGILLLTSVPGLAIDLAAAVLMSGSIADGDESEYLICIDTLFRMDEDREVLKGHFLLIPDPDSLQVILRAIRLA